MRKPEIGMTNLKLFIKHKSGFLVAGWTANKGDELHGDYEYVKDRVQGEKLLNDLKNLNEKTMCKVLSTFNGEGETMV